MTMAKTTTPPSPINHSDVAKIFVDAERFHMTFPFIQPILFIIICYRPDLMKEHTFELGQYAMEQSSLSSRKFIHFLSQNRDCIQIIKNLATQFNNFSKVIVEYKVHILIEQLIPSPSPSSLSSRIISALSSSLETCLLLIKFIYLLLNSPSKESLVDVKCEGKIKMEGKNSQKTKSQELGSIFELLQEMKKIVHDLELKLSSNANHDQKKTLEHISKPENDYDTKVKNEIQRNTSFHIYGDTNVQHAIDKYLSLVKQLRQSIPLQSFTASL